MPSPADYQDAVEKVVANSAALNLFVNGAADATVNTDNGAIPTLANLIADVYAGLAYTTLSSVVGLNTALAANRFLAITGTPANAVAITTPFWNFSAQLTTGDGKKRGKFFSHVNARPSSLGNWDSIGDAWSGDWSKQLFAHEHYVTGSGTMGSPTSGYLYTQETSGFAAYMFNNSGKNYSIDSNEGRTGVAYMFIKADQYGGGDAACITTSSFCAGAGPSGVTSWLAMPATVALNGTHTMGIDGGYLNFIEADLQLNGKDGAAIGMVANITRTIGDTPAGLGAYTAGFRVQSKASYKVDAALSGAGLFRSFIDMTPVTFDSNKIGIVMPIATRMYMAGVSTDGLKVSNPGQHWLECSSSGFLNFVYGNTSVMQMNNTQVTALVGFRMLPKVGADIPAASSSNKGVHYCVSDASSTTRGATYAGGGTATATIRSDGSRWEIV